MIVLFRACETRTSNLSTGSSETWEDKPRPELIRKCYKSLQPGLDSKDRIYLMNDSVSDDTIDWMSRNTDAMFDVHNLTPMREAARRHPYPNLHNSKVNICLEYIEILVKIAQDNPYEIIYVCEDDYLHTKNALIWMKFFLGEVHSYDFYVPYDYPDRYYLDRKSECELVLYGNHHFRTVPSATQTMAAKGMTWTRFELDVLRASVFNDDSWTWKAFSQVRAFCPVPGHATHLEKNCITPVIDWKRVYDEIETMD